MKEFEFIDPKTNYIITIKILENLNSDYSQYIWPSSPILASYVFYNRKIFENKTVLELSAGTALPAIVACKIGSHVTVSERDNNSLAKSIDSIILNNLSGSINKTILNWGIINDVPSFDIIISSDCFYDKKDFEEIICTIYYFMERNPDLIFFTTYEVRR
ncbi:hypothetical protein HZS_6932 [Henneguya salminicola]|nr:hypothetical protein HZS_6932 [Henneguya salminicola]